MGWLRDFMKTAEPSIPSFGKLSAACLDHSGWPESIQPKDRSLSTLFSKLDRGKDLDWLRDRVEVQQVLASLLKRPLGDIRLAIGETPAEGEGRFVRLIDVRYARELDLAHEDLPPGIPHEAFTPPLWGPTWWEAKSGSGRSLVAAWLKARGLAHTARIKTRDDLLRVPARGALFLEFDATLTEEQLGLTSADLTQLRASHRPLCVAAPFACAHSIFTTLHSAPPLDYLPELVDWIDERLDGSGNFHADRAETWMRKVAVPAGAARNFGDTLGLLGMTDETHPRSLLAKSLDELGRHFVERRLREANEHSSLSPRLAESAFPALQECAARVLVGAKNTLLGAYPVDEWTALLAPAGSEDAPDPEWFTEALRGALGAQVSRRDLRRAARKLPPSAFALTRSLEAAGLLVRDPQAGARDEHGADRHLHPRWLVSLLLSRATQEVLQLAPSQWGRVLLSPTSADDVIGALLAQTNRDNYAPSFALVDDFDASEIELVAALEGAIIANGLALLEGHDVPEDLVEGLLELAAAQVLQLDKVLEPQLTIEGATLYQRDLFLAALCALCFEVPYPLAHLDPFRSESLPLKRHFHSALGRALRTSAATSLRAVGLMKLQDALFPSGHEERSSALQLLDTLATATPELLDNALSETRLEHLLAFLDASNRSSEVGVRALWRLLADHPAIGSLFDSLGARRDFWRKAPAGALSTRTRLGLPIEWDFLLPHQYADWLSLSEASPLPSEAGAYLPIDAVLSVLDKDRWSLINDNALRAVIGRGAARFGPVLGRTLRDNDLEHTRQLLVSTPPQASAALARTLPDTRSLLGLRPPLLQEVRAFLLRACRQRHPEFTICYDKLMVLEAGLRPLKNLT